VRLALELLLHALDVVEIDVRVAEGVDEVAWALAGLVRDHREQERVATRC
jgi:hypothetical protein